jgi:pSer/pThr/pTyr-binding forkhead associated (FHA) protein
VVQLHILSGKKAGSPWVARRFPFRIGRSPQSALALDDAGVWDEHAEISVRPGDGVVLKSSVEASTLLNGERIQQAILRNGDLIEIGSVKMRFSLSATQQSGLRVREVATWVALVMICLGQVALIYWLAS